MNSNETEMLINRIYRAPRIYSDEELKGLCIDPKLIVFMSRPDFSDNSYALWEYVTRNTNYKTAWLLQHEAHGAKLTESGIVNAVYGAPEGIALARSARFFVHTINSTYVRKHPGQIFINLWHGAGVKATDYLAFHGDNQHLLNIKRVTDDTDLFLVHSVEDKINMAAEFNCDARKFIATGQPRLDRIKTADGRCNIKKILGGALDKYKKLVLYAPTARATSFSVVGEFFTSNVFNLGGYDNRRLDKLLERYDSALVVKLHPIDRDKFIREDMELGPRCYLLNDEDLFYADLQMNDILNAFDVLISDYSSIITDYLLLDRPIIYAIGDFEKYSRQEGFVYNDVSFYMPGTKALDFNSLLAVLEDAFVCPGRHGEWRKTVIKQRFSFLDDNSCARALEAIENFVPLTNYEEMYFTEKTLLPAVEKYGEEIKERDDRLRDYENRISSAVELIKKTPPSSKSLEAALSVLITPSISRDEQNALDIKNELESICDDILKNYSGEYVFFSLPQRYGWTGKTRTMVQQLAYQMARMGHLFLLGVTGGAASNNLPSVSSRPSARPAAEGLINLDYCHYTEHVLECLKRRGKKPVLIVPSDFFDAGEKIMETCSALAYRTIYIYRYPIKNYLCIKNCNRVNVSQWEALQYARRDENVIVVACGEELYDSVKINCGTKKILLQTPGVDHDMFAATEVCSDVPEKLKIIKAAGKPVIGYCGTIANHLYFSAVNYICGKRADYQFVFIGANRIIGTWGYIFDAYSNIHLLEEADYASMPAVINSFDAAMIPYFTSHKSRTPSKLFEYFACGKPVAATDMAIGQKYGHIFSGKSHGEFVTCLDSALAAANDTGSKIKSIKIAEQNDWKTKAVEVLNFIE